MNVPLVIIACFLFNFMTAQSDLDYYYLSKINDVRSKGCYCGKRFMVSTKALNWNSLLASSAFSQAKEMADNNFFNHYSKEGLNIGERFDLFGYNWLLAGENLAYGQNTIDEAISDWLKSKSHCIMLMNPEMSETAIVFYQNHWVQHFGKPAQKK